MRDKLAHTAEHAFVGSLQHKLGQTLQVRKVEHKKSGNTAFIVTPNLGLQAVLDAQADVNALIEQGRKVTEIRFGSMEEAKKALPGLRANEARITGEVRVVEIENHDVAACAMEHAENLHDCDFFLVTRVSKNGGEYEVDFVVGKQAKETSLMISARLMNVCAELGANINTVESTAKKLKADCNENRHKLRALGKEKLESVSQVQIGKVVLLKGEFANLDDDQVVEFAAEKISSQNTVVLFGNRGERTARVVFARNEKAGDMDLGALFKHVVGQDGRGGGKPHFVTGVVQNDALNRVIEQIADEVAKVS
jgi:alanyl-tRNA synthetase